MALNWWCLLPCCVSCICVQYPETMLRDFPSIMIIQIHPRVPDPNTAKRLIGNMFSLLQEAGKLVRPCSPPQWEILYHWHTPRLLINQCLALSSVLVIHCYCINFLHSSILHFLLRLHWCFLRVQSCRQKNAGLSQDSGAAPGTYSGRTTNRLGHHGNKAVNNNLCFKDIKMSI